MAIANLFARGLGFGGPEWLITRGLSFNVEISRWSDLGTDGQSWAAAGSGAASSWSQLASYTSTRNLSRFILLNPSASTDGVDFQTHLRTLDSPARGYAFYFTTSDYIILSVNGDILR